MAQEKTQRIWLPLTHSLGLSAHQVVRKRSGQFQVKVDRTLPMPCGDMFSNWVEEMTSYTEGVTDPVVNHERSYDEFGYDTISLTGWVIPTPEQLTIIEKEFCDHEA